MPGDAARRQPRWVERRLGIRHADETRPDLVGLIEDWHKGESRPGSAAIADCNDALRLQEGSYMAYATRGAAFRQKGDFGTATADLERALRLKPDYQWARDQLDLARRRHR